MIFKKSHLRVEVINWRGNATSSACHLWDEDRAVSGVCTSTEVRAGQTPKRGNTLYRADNYALIAGKRCAAAPAAQVD